MISQKVSFLIKFLQQSFFSSFNNAFSHPIQQSLPIQNLIDLSLWKREHMTYEQDKKRRFPGKLVTTKTDYFLKTLMMKVRRCILHGRSIWGGVSLLGTHVSVALVWTNLDQHKKLNTNQALLQGMVQKISEQVLFLRDQLLQRETFSKKKQECKF